MKTIASIPAPCCAPNAPPLPEDACAALAAQLKALADPARIAIVNRLAGTDELCVCVLTEGLGVSQPTVSHHLRVLREAGLVDMSKRGTWSFYRLRPDAVGEIARALTG